MTHGEYRLLLDENKDKAQRMLFNEYFNSDDTAIYGLNFDNTLEKTIDFVSSGLSGLSNVTPIADGDFVC